LGEATAGQRRSAPSVGGYVGPKVTDQISPEFHAEIIVILFDEYRDLRAVTSRVGILLSDAA
jgi:hypothetical protein